MSLVAGLLNQSITGIYRVSTDGYGDTSTTIVHSNVQCRWEEIVSEISTKSGDSKKYKVTMWVMPDITIKEGYQVVKDSETYIVIDAQKQYGIDGVHDHTEVFLE